MLSPLNLWLNLHCEHQFSRPEESHITIFTNGDVAVDVAICKLSNSNVRQNNRAAIHLNRLVPFQ